LSLLALASSAATTSVRYSTIVFLVLLFGSSFISTTAQNTFAPKFPELGLREVLFAANDKMLHATDTARTRFERRARGRDARRIVWGQVTNVTNANVFAGLLLWGGALLAFMRWRLRPFEVHKG
jgi:hypothetical protein